MEIPCLGILNYEMRYLGGANNIDLAECRLISVDSICTGYLWPANCDERGLQFLQAKATFLKDGLFSWTDGKSRTRSNAISVDKRLAKNSELPDYDQNGSPWGNLGLWSQILEWKEWNDTETAAIEVLRQIPALSFANTEFEIVLEDTEDWE